MNDFLPWVGVLTPVLLAGFGWWTAHTVRRLNTALADQAMVEVEATAVGTEEAWQRLYSKTVEELERTEAKVDAIIVSREDCEEKLAHLEDEVTLLRAEVIRLGGDPRRLR